MQRRTMFQMLAAGPTALLDSLATATEVSPPTEPSGPLTFVFPAKFLWSWEHSYPQLRLCDEDWEALEPRLFEALGHKPCAWADFEHTFWSRFDFTFFVSLYHQGQLWGYGDSFPEYPVNTMPFRMEGDTFAESIKFAISRIDTLVDAPFSAKRVPLIDPLLRNGPRLHEVGFEAYAAWRRRVLFVYYTRFHVSNEVSAPDELRVVFHPKKNLSP